MRRLLTFVAIGLVLAAGAAGCQTIRSKIGLATTIKNPDPGTPEKVLQDVLKAASNPNEEEGWVQFTGLLHTEEVSLPGLLSGWRSMKYPAIRKKASYFITDQATASYDLMDKREEGRSLMLYVRNSQSDMPTPCKFRQDPAQGNAWKVFNSCF